MSNNSRTVGRSFRVQEKWLNILNEEAEKERISPNSLVNRILQDYCTFGRNDKNFPTLTLSQKLFTQLIACCPKERFIVLAKEVGIKNYQDIANITGLEPNQESIIYFIRELLSRHLNWFVYSSYTKKGKIVFHLRHHLGEKWSIYISELLSNIYENVLNVKLKTELTEEAVTIYMPMSEPVIKTSQVT